MYIKNKKSKTCTFGTSKNKQKVMNSRRSFSGVSRTIYEIGETSSKSD